MGIKAPIEDFRDWAAITAWTTAIAETMKYDLLHPSPVV